MRPSKTVPTLPVRNPDDVGSAMDTKWGTREFPPLDLAGNVLTFYRRS